MKKMINNLPMCDATILINGFAHQCHRGDHHMGMHVTNMRLSNDVFKGFGWGVDPGGQIVINMPLLSAMTVFYDKDDCEWDTTTYPNAECFRLKKDSDEVQHETN